MGLFFGEVQRSVGYSLQNGVKNITESVYM
jgi:hypothetical protein